MSSANRKIRVSCDRGGTFCDMVAFVPEGNRTIILKILSTDPSYNDAPTECVRQLLELVDGVKRPRGQPLDTKLIENIRMGTTVATNSLLERTGEKVLLIVTKGFKDLNEIGNQTREDIFQLKLRKKISLVSRILEADERVTVVKKGGDVQGLTGEEIQILKALDVASLRPQLIQARKDDYKSVAICLLHAYTFTAHELAIESLCQEYGFEHISISSRTSPMIKIVPRQTSTVVDSYLTPGIQSYLKSFLKGFDSGIDNVAVEFMTSDGGLAKLRHFNAFKAILSGPAGGVVGFAQTSYLKGGRAIIGLDVGGTSTDVSIYAGTYNHVMESFTAGVNLQAPQLDINTVASGGGSILTFRNGMFLVGPESAGANPGPCCYRKSGPLTVTDANLVLGRINLASFPRIFGPNEDQMLDLDASLDKFRVLRDEINNNRERKLSIDEVAHGFITVANECMSRPIRALTQGKGHATSDHILAAFGGAGGQVAFGIARLLDINMILIHRYSSILSAYGIALAERVEEVQEPTALVFSDEKLDQIKVICDRLVARARNNLSDFDDNSLHYEIYLNLRYEGTDNSIMTLKPLDGWEFKGLFKRNYKLEFGFDLENRDIIVDDVRVRGIGKSGVIAHTNVQTEILALDIKAAAPSTLRAPIYWAGLGRVDTEIYFLKNVAVGESIQGPALLLDETSTIAVEPCCHVVITSTHIVGYVSKPPTTRQDTLVQDPILLSLFGHRFMSIAEQMGVTLQKSAISVNIAQRLDFSCALFGPEGDLVANAPHIPIHLGSMGTCLKWQMNNREIKDGEVLLSNHPDAGGSHLPDITVMTPVFDKGLVVFFVASRGHHSDIGGMRAGSMPPNSTELYQEGAAIRSHVLVKDGLFDEVGITKLLVEDPGQYAGCKGSRNIKDNISDLKAAVAANHRGVSLVKKLIQEYGLVVVQRYMRYIQENAYEAVIALLLESRAKYGAILKAHDYMDDGSKIDLTIAINEDGTCIFDFEGTSSEVYGNTNAPVAVTYSCIIYALRCLIDLDIPLNQGALGPVTIKIPVGCILNPSQGAAVVGGNVLTSQRVCDVIFKAFNAVADGQGCCNNLTFGRDAEGSSSGFGYYETIGGGSGAGPSWHGRSGAQIHITNSRITDVEVLERLYPVLIREFSIREGSGGVGKFRGGNGLVRDIEFREPLEVSMLSERRVFSPNGVEGGGNGAKGLNLLIRAAGTEASDKVERVISFGGKNSTSMRVGDRIRILTPGGGGWGTPTASSDLEDDILAKDSAAIVVKAGGSLANYRNMQNTN